MSKVHKPNRISLGEFTDNLNLILNRVVDEDEAVLVESESGELVEVKRVTEAESRPSAKTQEDYEAFLASFGGWKDEDVNVETATSEGDGIWSQSDSDKRWLRTDLQQEAASALEMVREQLHLVQDDPYRWKWVILALHSAVQNFMILALRGTNNLTVMRDKDAEAWLQAYENDEPLPRSMLDSYKELYKKVKSDKMMLRPGSRKFVPKDQQGRSIKELNNYRNKFVHYMPRSLSIPLLDLSAISIDCMRLIGFLINESNNIQLRPKEHQQLQRLLTEIDENLSRLHAEYTAAVPE